MLELKEYVKIAYKKLKDVVEALSGAKTESVLLAGRVVPRVLSL